MYPLDYARKRLVSDVGPGKKIFDGLPGCLKKTASGPKSLFSFHAGLGVSLGGIIPYRGFQLAALDIIVGLCPWKNDTGTMGFFFTFAVAQIAIIIGAGISYPSTLFVGTSRRRQSSQLSNISTRAPLTAGRRSSLRWALPLASTRASSPTRSAVSAESGAGAL